MAKRINIHGLEIVSALVLMVGVFGLAWLHNADMNRYYRDQSRKTSINAVYQNLEELYYPAKKGYPMVITEDTFAALNPDTLKDPSGNMLGNPRSDYSYSPSDCEQSLCKSYVLRTSLENETTYVKSSLN